MIIEFENQINVSVQIGDVAYYSKLTASGGYDVSNDVFEIGKISEIQRISPYSITIPTANLLNNPAPDDGDFIMFLKDTRVNTSGIKGYFAKAKFINDSNQPAELFAVSSEINESSK